MLPTRPARTQVLMKTAPYFIRCVKPNDTKMPNNFNNKAPSVEADAGQLLWRCFLLYRRQNKKAHLKSLVEPDTRLKEKQA